MDPYLEGPLWTTFHFSYAAELVRLLAPRLRPRYLVLPVERMVLEETSDIAVMTSSIYPDVGGVEAQLSLPAHTDVAVIEAPLQLATVMPQSVPHVSIEIRDVAQRQLVTAIEILSPTNKRGEGRSEYLLKRRRLLLSSAHLLELDLLREGQRVPMQQPLPAAPYFVMLSRVDRRPLLDIWPVSIQQPLPRVPVPLLAGDGDLTLDLQAAFTAAYDLLGYDVAIDYRQPPQPPLSGSLKRWADERLREERMKQ
jgi:hypothetical protein